MKSVLPLLAALVVGALGLWACRPHVGPAPDASSAATVPVTATLPPTKTIAQTPPEPRNYAGTLPAPDASWKEHQTEAFSIRLPEYWRAAEPDAAGAAVLSGFQQDNPELSGFLGGASQQADLTFAALDESSAAGGFADNVNIRRTSLDGQGATGLPEITATIAAQYQQLGFDVLETSTSFEAGGLPAARITYGFAVAGRDGQKDALSGVQFLVAVPDKLWIVTYTTTSDRFAALRPVFEQSARSFRIK